MRTVDNQTIYTRGFLLQKGAVHDLGPNTWQLNDNWRMVTISLEHPEKKKKRTQPFFFFF